MSTRDKTLAPRIDGGELQEALLRRARTLANIGKKIEGQHGKDALARVVNDIDFATDPQATLADKHRLPLSRPRVDVAEAALHLNASIREAKLALRALGIDWQDEPARVDRAA